MNNKQPSLEVIAFKDREFSTKMTALWEQLLSVETAAEAQAHPARIDIMALIRATFGLKINLVVKTWMSPSTQPALVAGHVMDTKRPLNPFQGATGKWKDTIKKLENNKGAVDMKTGKVSGLYANIETNVWMPFGFCKGVLGPAKSAAVFMHEVGHNYLVYELMGRTVYTSQILSALHQVRAGVDDSVTYEYALEVAGTQLFGDKKALEECVTLKNETAITAVVVNKLSKNLASDFDSREAAVPSFERMADNFAARCGYARELYLALADLEEGNYKRRDVAADLSAAVSGMVPVGAIVAVVLFRMVMDILLFVMFAPYDNVYDKPVDRLRRLRETVIEQMKNKLLTDEERKMLAEDLKHIDATHKYIEDYNFGQLSTKIKNFFSRGSARQSYAVELEKELEQLSNNDLFAAANKLRTL